MTRAPESRTAPPRDLPGRRVPILQAGMGGRARSELAAAACEAGGFGTLGMVRESLEPIACEVDAARARTTRPFAVSLIPAATDPALPCPGPRWTPAWIVRCGPSASSETSGRRPSRWPRRQAPTC